MQQNLTVEVTRGGQVESQHQVIAVICDVFGRRHSQWGNVDQLVYTRSSAKPLQALPLIVSGAADALGLTDKQLAMACSSHNGEIEHTETVTNWLSQLGMTDQHLECGSHWPMYEPATIGLAKSGAQACNIHNNCSGKHCGFLSLAHHQGFDPSGYIDHQHPVQLAVNDAMGQMMDLNIADYPMGIDGCSIPTYALPLTNFAMGFARFGAGEQVPEGWQHACKRLYDAMVTQPFYVAGSERHCTNLMRAYGGKVACKTGAEGVFGAAVPSLGLGIAIKALDGSSRASEVALNALLQHLDVNPTDPNFNPEISLHNRNQMRVGVVRMARGSIHF